MLVLQRRCLRLTCTALTFVYLNLSSAMCCHAYQLFMTYSWSAYSPFSLPNPDCLYPPNGTFVAGRGPELTQIDPALSLCAESMALLTFSLKTYAARPYTVSFAFLIISSQRRR